MTWVWSALYDEPLRVEELTELDHILLTFFVAPLYGPEIEGQWEEVARRGREDEKRFTWKIPPTN